MSLLVSHKRLLPPTCSSSPRPAKAPRLDRPSSTMGATPLRRTESYIHIDHRRRRPLTIRLTQQQHVVRHVSLPPPRPCPVSPLPSTPCQQTTSSDSTLLPSRHTSPLAPTRSPRPSRPSFPRSKPDVNLHRQAIRTCMLASPEGQKIIRMGPRLALDIMSATRELERLVAEADITMLDGTADPPHLTPPAPLTTSWVVVPGDDWEMIDCAA